LHEFDPDANHFTGEQCEVEITSMTSFAQPCAVSGEALNPDFCILSIRFNSSEMRGLDPSANLDDPRATTSPAARPHAARPARRTSLARLLIS
jgi:hypothetical protein